jgi:phosphoribosylaminoimidazole-succinocarboxamide synthase
MVSSSVKAALQDALIEEFDAAETKELDRLAEETRKDGISWEDLKAELGL